MKSTLPHNPLWEMVHDWVNERPDHREVKDIYLNMGISRQCFYEGMKAGKRPSAEKLARICKAMRMTPSTFWNKWLALSAKGSNGSLR